MQRAFASLTPQEALHAAIFIEERNAEIYHRFAEMFTEFRDADSLEIASVFWDMAVEEKRHSSLLQVKYQERYGNASCSLTEEDLQEMIEVPRLEDGRCIRGEAGATNSARVNVPCRSLWRRRRAPMTSTPNWWNRPKTVRCAALYRAIDNGRRARGLPAEVLGEIRSSGDKGVQLSDAIAVSETSFANSRAIKRKLRSSYSGGAYPETT